MFIVVLPCTAEARVTSIAAGGGHVLALNDDGTVLAWGHNRMGELGIGVAGNSQKTPQKVLIDNVTAIAASGSNSLALKKDGTVWAWGNGADGSLGNGGTEPKYSPVQVTDLTNVTAIACGYGCYALKDDGTVWAWGNNYNGALGDDTTENRLIPAQINGLTDIVALGEKGSFAIKGDGTVWAWGSNDYGDYYTISYGALGDTTGPGVRTPFQVGGLQNVKQIIRGGESYTLYLQNNGTVWGWGGKFYGELGDGNQNSSCCPPFVEEITNTRVQAKISDVEKISSTFYHTVALKRDGTVWFWGKFIDGRTMYNNVQGTSTPYQISGLDQVVDIAAGDQCCIVLKEDGSIWGWGDNHYNALLDHGKYVAEPVMLLEGSPVTTSTQMIEPTNTAINNSSFPGTLNDISTVTPNTPVTTPGFSFNNIAGLYSLLIIVGLLTGFVRRKGR
ncbi:predicted regulator of chromosome condensation [Methanocella arvoryzae MRE50]|uniref:Predicted regulator of chromosome condensation n=1 Tax=Methanocella arvoryzae (strain DSM 22066 / NBRC 105507 / MRE50) TaxID=351160 RepID=Q0W617_METAR|nr:predicted regulator of chromosome condensation [Methanocella arvoryzae MRE50]